MINCSFRRTGLTGSPVRGPPAVFRAVMLVSAFVWPSRLQSSLEMTSKSLGHEVIYVETRDLDLQQTRSSTHCLLRIRTLSIDEDDVTL